MSEQISTSFIGNRKPDELLNAVALYFREKAITASVNDHTTGIIAGTGDDPELSSLYLDCSLLPQTQNIRSITVSSRRSGVPVKAVMFR